MEMEADFTELEILRALLAIYKDMHDVKPMPRDPRLIKFQFVDNRLYLTWDSKDSFQGDSNDVA